MRSPRPGWFEQSVDDWWSSLTAALRALLDRLEGGRIAAMAITNQRETVGFLDRKGNELRPVILWLDERCRPDVAMVAQKIGAERFRRITGKTPDPTPAIFSAHWVWRNEPDLWARLGALVDVHGYLLWRLTGLRRTSWASADPHGFLDLEEKRYSDPLLALLDLRRDQLFEPLPPGAAAGTLREEVAAELGLPPGLPVAAGGGDGQAAGLGVGLIAPGRAYLNLGTAAVSGVYADRYTTDPGFRTLASLDAEGYVLELCLRTGSFLTDWMIERLFGFDPTRDPGAYDRLESEAGRLAPGAEGLLLLPYWSGAMSPWWDADARGAIVGLAPAHGRAHLYRALMEAVAFDMAMGFEAIESCCGSEIEEVVAIGGGARSTLWRQILADVTGRPVRRSETVEATCLGAGMLAACGAGWYRNAREAAAAMSGRLVEESLPDPDRHRRYREILDLYRALYPSLQPIFARLARLQQDRP